MEEVNKFLEGFKVITTPYDKVNTNLVTKNNIMTALGQIGGGDPDPAPGPITTPAPGPAPEPAIPPATEPAIPPATVPAPEITETGDEGLTDPEKSKGVLGILGDKYKNAAMESAKSSEDDKGTTIPSGKDIMKKIIKVGTIIIYIMLLPLMPWYYIMKNSYKKLHILFKGMVRPL